MVVESLVLGTYKDLTINQEALKTSRADVTERIKFMATEKAESMGFGTNSGTVIMLDDDTAKGLFIEGVDSIQSLETHVSKEIFRENLINSIMRQVLDHVKITYNEDAVTEELDQMMVSIERQATEEGFTLEFFCDYNNLGSVDDLRKLYAEEIRTSYLEIETLKAIAKTEGLTEDSYEFETIKKKYLIEHGGETIEDEEAFRTGLLCQATVNWLVEVNL